MKLHTMTAAITLIGLLGAGPASQPTEPPSSRPADIYPALQKQLRKALADVEILRTELWKLKAENSALKEENEKLKAAASKNSPPPTIAEAIKSHTLLLGMTKVQAEEAWGMQAVQDQAGEDYVIYRFGTQTLFRIGADGKINWLAGPPNRGW